MIVMKEFKLSWQPSHFYDNDEDLFRLPKLCSTSAYGCQLCRCIHCNNTTHLLCTGFGGITTYSGCRWSKKVPITAIYTSFPTTVRFELTYCDDGGCLPNITLPSEEVAKLPHIYNNFDTSAWIHSTQYWECQNDRVIDDYGDYMMFREHVYYRHPVHLSEDVVWVETSVCFNPLECPNPPLFVEMMQCLDPT